MSQKKDETRPKLSPKGQESLENLKTAYGWWVIHQAEEKTLSEERTEINESDIGSVGKPFPVQTSKRIWFMRALLGLMFALILSLWEAFSELQYPSVEWAVFRLALPSVAVFIMLIVFALTFRENL